MKEKKERVCRQLLEFNAKPSPPRDFVKFQFQIWSGITKKIAKRCLDGSSQ